MVRQQQTQQAKDKVSALAKAASIGIAARDYLQATETQEAITTEQRQAMLNSIPGTYEDGYEAGRQDTMDMVDPTPADTAYSALQQIKDRLLKGHPTSGDYEALMHAALDAIQIAKDALADDEIEHMSNTDYQDLVADQPEPETDTREQQDNEGRDNIIANLLDRIELLESRIDDLEDEMPADADNRISCLENDSHTHYYADGDLRADIDNLEARIEELESNWIRDHKDER